MRRLFGDKLACGPHQGENDAPWMSARVFQGNTLKLVELEAGMPGWGKKVKTKCSVMEEIKHLRSVLRNAIVEPTASTHVWLGCHLHFSPVQEWSHKDAETLKYASMN